MTGEEARADLMLAQADISYRPKDDSIDMAIEALEKQKTGHWIVHPEGIYAHLVCDKCLSSAPYDCRTNYCPNCGAKMKGE